MWVEGGWGWMVGVGFVILSTTNLHTKELSWQHIVRDTKESSNSTGCEWATREIIEKGNGISFPSSEIVVNREIVLCEKKLIYLLFMELSSSFFFEFVGFQFSTGIFSPPSTTTTMKICCFSSERFGVEMRYRNRWIEGFKATFAFLFLCLPSPYLTDIKTLSTIVECSLINNLIREKHFSFETSTAVFLVFAFYATTFS